MNKRQWWGYKHTNGNYQTKPYFGPQDITEAKESPFCAIVVGPFEAEDREEALIHVEILTGIQELENAWKSITGSDTKD